MITCLIRADWGEQGARGSKNTVKEDNLLMLKKIWVWRGGEAIRNMRSYNPSEEKQRKKKVRSNLP